MAEPIAVKPFVVEFYCPNCGTSEPPVQEFTTHWYCSRCGDDDF